MPKILQYDHYKVLGVPLNATAGEVRKAYREQVKICHPDLNASPKAAAAFSAVQDAYETLIDEEKRATYNERMQYYRKHVEQGERPVQRPATRSSEENKGPATISFAALHLVGVVFGCAVGIRVLLQVLFHDLPIYTLLICIPALLILPDAYRGLRKALKSWE